MKQMFQPNTKLDYVSLHNGEVDTHGTLIWLAADRRRNLIVWGQLENGLLAKNQSTVALKICSIPKYLALLVTTYQLQPWVN